VQDNLLRFHFSKLTKRLTARVTGGWGEKGLETGNCQTSEKALKNAQSPSRPVHAVLGKVFKDSLDERFPVYNNVSSLLR